MSSRVFRIYSDYLHFNPSSSSPEAFDQAVTFTILRVNKCLRGGKKPRDCLKTTSNAHEWDPVVRTNAHWWDPVVRTNAHEWDPVVRTNANEWDPLVRTNNQWRLS